MIFVFVILLIIFSAIIYLVSDYNGTRRIKLKPSAAFGIDCLKAKDLIVQEFDNEGNLWATRGYIIYCLRRGENEFGRAARVPSGFSIFWLNNFSIVRRFTLRSECVELTVSEEGKITAFASGIIWYSSGLGQKFQKVKTLEHFGRRIGRGIMSTGILQANRTEFFLGEYFNNPDRASVSLYNFNNEYKLWKTSYKFKPGQIRHIHALQKDQYTGRLWICVGDEKNEPMIGWSDDNYRNITPIGSGSQIWRTCQLVFTEEAIFWGTDTGSKDLAGIYRWDKKSEELKQVHRTEGAVFFAVALKNGTIVMSTDREGFPNENDDKTRLILLNRNGEIVTIACGSWKYKKHGFRFNFAKLRLQRSIGDDSLVISALNQKEFPESELFIIPQENLVCFFRDTFVPHVHDT
jgi:hypothetical protein